MANSEVNKNYETTFVIDENKYDINIQQTNNSLIVTAEDQNTKIQYKTTKSDADILNLTKKASYTMNTTTFYDMIISGFERRDSVTIDGKIVGSAMILVVRLVMNLGFTKDKKIYTLVMNQVEQTDIELMTKMLQGLTKKFPHVDLDQIIASRKADDIQIRVLRDICNRLMQSVNSNEKLCNNDGRHEAYSELSSNLKNDYDDLKQDIKRLDIELPDIKNRLNNVKKECETIVDCDLANIRERLVEVEKYDDSIWYLENNCKNLIESLIDYEQETQILNRELCNTKTQLKRIKNDLNDLKLLSENNSLNVAPLTNYNRIAGFWSSDNKQSCPNGIEIKFDVCKKNSNSSLIITGCLNAYNVGCGQQIWEYGNGIYYGMVYEHKSPKIYIMPCNFILKDDTFIGTQSLKLSFSSHSVQIINPNSSLHTVMHNTYSFIQVTEIII